MASLDVRLFIISTIIKTEPLTKNFWFKKPPQGRVPLCSSPHSYCRGTPLEAFINYSTLLISQAGNNVFLPQFSCVIGKARGSLKTIPYCSD